MCFWANDCLDDCWECQDNNDACLWPYDDSQAQNFDTFDCNIACDIACEEGIHNYEYLAERFLIKKSFFLLYQNWFKNKKKSSLGAKEAQKNNFE
mgnify:CR=1 FL=1